MTDALSVADDFKARCDWLGLVIPRQNLAI
jgi:hypothetical protein